MKKRNTQLLIALFLAALFSSCSSGENATAKKEINPNQKAVNESEVLLNFLEKSGNVINSKKVPTLISAEKVKAGLSKFHIIDLRKKKLYVAGHIDGAVNVPSDKLIAYMKNEITANNYEKVVLVCNTNHLASYAAGMLQLLGYENVYAMKWGMCAWDKAYAKKRWDKNISNNFASQMTTEEVPVGQQNPFPTINTGKKTGYAILEAQAQRLLTEKKFKVSAKKVFEDLSKFYIVNYWKKEHYDIAHIPGAMQYTPKKSLTKESMLATLPTNKAIALYCYTGQNAAFTTAYLNVLGYNVKAVKYGANAMMYNTLKSKKMGHYFDINKHSLNYPMVKGELPSLKKAGSKQANKQIKVTTLPVIKKKKKEMEEEGGC